tara:strand:+ start:350 stop:895 length:546 start_codon:yes stop_codon:yes gene_type:complete
MLGCTQDGMKVAPEQLKEETTGNDTIPLYRLGDWGTIEQFVKANEGKVVVIDIWSTYCAPCMKEFPRLVALQKNHGDKIACASFNINYAGLPDQTPETDIEFIEPFLEKHGNSVDHIISTITDEKIYAMLDIYAIPAVLIYNSQGILTDKILDENAYESTVYPRISEMLGNPTPSGESDDT